MEHDPSSTRTPTRSRSSILLCCRRQRWRSPHPHLRSLRLWCTRDAAVLTWLSAPLGSHERGRGSRPTGQLPFTRALGRASCLQCCRWRRQRREAEAEAAAEEELHLSSLELIVPPPPACHAEHGSRATSRLRRRLPARPLLLEHVHRRIHLRAAPPRLTTSCHLRLHHLCHLRCTSASASAMAATATTATTAATAAAAVATLATHHDGHKARGC